MTFHIGDDITQIGNHNAVVKHGQPSIDDLVAAAGRLREHVPDADREDFERSVAQVGEQGADARSALRELAGIATVIGPAGDAVRALVRALAQRNA